MHPDFFFGQPFFMALAFGYQRTLFHREAEGFEVPYTICFNFKYPLFHIFNVKEAKLNEHE